jgi:hypothetical protein
MSDWPAAVARLNSLLIRNRVERQEFVWRTVSATAGTCRQLRQRFERFEQLERLERHALFSLTRRMALYYKPKRYGLMCG